MERLYIKKLNISEIKDLGCLERIDNKIDFHQTILNIGYKYWQEVKNINYKQMIEYMNTTYGQLFGDLILIGKYNQQVCNNGHFGYYENGYADGDGGCFNERDFTHPVHTNLHLGIKRIIDLPNLFNEEELEILKKFEQILQDFLSININKKRVIEKSGTDILDKRYYDINEKVMEIFEKVSEMLFEKEK